MVIVSLKNIFIYYTLEHTHTYRYLCVYKCKWNVLISCLITLKEAIKFNLERNMLFTGLLWWNEVTVSLWFTRALSIHCLHYRLSQLLSRDSHCELLSHVWRHGTPQRHLRNWPWCSTSFIQVFNMLFPSILFIQLWMILSSW